MSTALGILAPENLNPRQTSHRLRISAMDARHFQSKEFVTLWRVVTILIFVRIVTMLVCNMPGAVLQM